MFEVCSKCESIKKQKDICVNGHLYVCGVRYMAIIHPLQQRLTSTETRVVMAVIWMLALLLAFPQYYYSTTTLLPGRTVCYIDWPEYTIMDFKKM